jgi:hypothetical protein
VLVFLANAVLDSLDLTVARATAGGALPCKGTSLQNLPVPSFWMMAGLPDGMGSADVGLLAL